MFKGPESLGDDCFACFLFPVVRRFPSYYVLRTKQYAFIYKRKTYKAFGLKQNRQMAPKAALTRARLGLTWLLEYSSYPVLSVLSTVTAAVEYL